MSFSNFRLAINRGKGMQPTEDLTTLILRNTPHYEYPDPVVATGNSATETPTNDGFNPRDMPPPPRPSPAIPIDPQLRAQSVPLPSVERESSCK